MLDQREVRPEIMDTPDMAGERHCAALRGLERINAWSGSARILWPALMRLARESGEEIRVLDVATGAGDVPIRLWQKARQKGSRMVFDGIDRNLIRNACHRFKFDPGRYQSQRSWFCLHGCQIRQRVAPTNVRGLSAGARARGV